MDSKKFIETQKPVEEVKYVDEYKIPSYEEFMKTYESDDKVSYTDLEGDSTNGVKSYGPCHSCGNKNLTFKLKAVLKNGGGIIATFYSTEHAEQAVKEIRNETGHWAGDWRTGPFPQRTREIVANEIIQAIDRHKNGENIDETVSAGSSGECFDIM